MDESFVYPLPLSETAQLFLHSRSQKPARFPDEQNECVHHATPSFCPSAVAAEQIDRHLKKADLVVVLLRPNTVFESDFADFLRLRDP